MAHTTDVDAMLAQMTPEQFHEWCAKDRVEPIGHAGTHEILSQIACMIAMFRGAKDVTPWTYKYWLEKPEAAGDSDMEAAAMALETLGAKRTRG